MIDYENFYLKVGQDGVFLGDVLPSLCVDLCRALRSIGRHELISEIEMLFIPKQRISFDLEVFSFSCYAFQRKTYEERLRSKILDLDDLALSLNEVDCTLSFDVFGGVCWLTIRRGFGWFGELSKFMTK